MFDSFNMNLFNIGGYENNILNNLIYNSENIIG